MTDITDSATWIPAVHFTHPRDGVVSKIVLHWMATTLAGADATFSGGAREASAHYGIEDDVIHQYVREGDAAWHAANRTVNHSSIGIEHSAEPGRDASEATILTSIEVCTALCRRYGLDASALHKHSEYIPTQCPGTLPVERIRKAVAANLAAKPPAVVPPAKTTQTDTTPPPPPVQEDDMADTQTQATLAAILQQAKAANENAGEARRVTGVLLGALPPGNAGEAKFGERLDALEAAVKALAPKV